MSESRLIHGEALEELSGIPIASIDVVITDPPYVIGAVSAGNMGSKAGGWGDMMNSAYWFQAWYKECWRVLKPSGSLWSFCNWRSLPVVMNAASQARIPITSVLVWNKEWIGPGGPQGLRPTYELIVLMSKPDFYIPHRGTPDIWTCKWTGEKPTGHPAEKPVELLRRIIRTTGIGPSAVVLDPFMGSGSTGVACVLEDRNFVGIEQEAYYIAMADARIVLAQSAQQQPLSFTDAPELLGATS